MTESTIVQAQLAFYKRGGAGCLFAAYAANNPKKFEWKLTICEPKKMAIESVMVEAIASREISTQSIIFPDVRKIEHLKNLLLILQKIPLVSLGQKEVFLDAICFGYRIKVNGFTSWVTGFGDFDFLPKTRQSPFTEITFRSKARPLYEWVMKEAPEGVIHLADMDMKGMPENKFKSLWRRSFERTKSILGTSPDLRSAAQTTFAIPTKLWIEG